MYRWNCKTVYEIARARKAVENGYDNSMYVKDLRSRGRLTQPKNPPFGSFMPTMIVFSCAGMALAFKTSENSRDAYTQLPGFRQPKESRAPSIPPKIYHQPMRSITSTAYSADTIPAQELSDTDTTLSMNPKEVLHSLARTSSTIKSSSQI